MATREAYVQKMEARLKPWGATLDELLVKAEASGTEERVVHQQRMDDLKEKYQSAQSELEGLRDATGENWRDLKIDLENACKAMEVAAQKLAK